MELPVAGAVSAGVVFCRVNRHIFGHEIVFAYNQIKDIPIPILEIDADFPSLDSDYEPAGKRFAQFLAASLNSDGFRVTKPELHSTYGWFFYVTHNNVTAWCMLQFSDNWILTVECPFFLTYWLLCRKPSLRLKAIHEKIEQVLLNDARVESIEWYTRKQFELRYSQGID